MRDGLRNELIITIVDKGILALLISTILLGAQFWVGKVLDESKNRLTYERIVAEKRVEKLEEIWNAVNKYAESVKLTLVIEKQTTELIRPYEIELYNKLSQYGIHLGIDEINSIKSKINLNLIVEGKVDQFEAGFLSVLSDLEEKIKLQQ